MNAFIFFIIIIVCSSVKIMSFFLSSDEADEEEKEKKDKVETDKNACDSMKLGVKGMYFTSYSINQFNKLIHVYVCDSVQKHSLIHELTTDLLTVSAKYDMEYGVWNGK